MIWSVKRIVICFQRFTSQPSFELGSDLDLRYPNNILVFVVPFTYTKIRSPFTRLMHTTLNRNTYNISLPGQVPKLEWPHRPGRALSPATGSSLTHFSIDSVAFIHFGLLREKRREKFRTQWKFVYHILLNSITFTNL